ncbi:hypothetical protein [Streptomyces cathayae]|uniref:Uncharacterized protein n=1 Tax=Streptomyces cathayae TaxID=3031124 RepID=A0ABY8JTJ7_9ACTN|nr:hypothetical protein [Streptomyces sp. HUAS 5]WGD38703.1 hypothetical protein PYS65_00075 [Streptomyces sp. HUAS 5]WGD44743.1 hypothetical protein PYS65_34045 [Streptomyces sp. HUAS 5]WGD45214.1 hypothetical protein PYS65_34575 [Streptomyces sp. HUAS 5]
MTHVGLDTSRLGNVRQQGRQTEITLNRTRAVLIALNAVGGAEQVRQLNEFFAWPLWRGAAIPSVSPEWTAVFSTAARALEGIHGAAPQEGKPMIIRPAVCDRLTDAMWEMLQTQNCVVLCTGVAGDPTAPQLGAAASDGSLHAALARVILH